MPEPGTFMWNQLVTDDQGAAGVFYFELFGWKRNEIDGGPLGTYTVFQRGAQDVAGMMNPTARSYGHSPPPRWTAYIAVENTDAVAERVTELGGTILEPPHDIPGVGRVCMFEDPVNALIYVLQPATPQG